MSTTVGETGADYLVVHVGLGTLDHVRLTRRIAAFAASRAPVTAASDLATEAPQMGFTLGVIAFGVLIAITALAYFGGADPIVTFWIAYVLTRSLGDLHSQAKPMAASGSGPL